MKFRKIIFPFIIILNLNIYSQKIFNENRNRKFSDTLNIELLHKVCNNLKIPFSDVYTYKSHSLNFKTDKTFFVLQYIIKKESDGNLYTTKYLFAENLNGKIIDQIDSKESFYDNEAIQPSPSYILENTMKLSSSVVGIGIISEESVRSCATLYSEQKFSIVSLLNNKIINLLDNYIIRKTQGESNCSGNHEIEILEKSLNITENLTKELFNISVTKTFTYENIVEENSDEKIKGKEIIKSKTETGILTFNGKNYNFEKDEKLRFLKW